MVDRRQFCELFVWKTHNSLKGDSLMTSHILVFLEARVLCYRKSCEQGSVLLLEKLVTRCVECKILWMGDEDKVSITWIATSSHHYNRIGTLRFRDIKFNFSRNFSVTHENAKWFVCSLHYERSIVWCQCDDECSWKK